MKIRFIVNPLAGGSNRVAEITKAVREVFASEQGIFEIKVANAAGAAGELSREALKKGYEIIVACGGDGTIHESATPLVGTGATLGIIPLGSGNALARVLGIPRNIRSAVEMIKDGNARSIDVGVICDRYFFSTAGIGFEAHLSKKYNESSVIRRIRGLAPYMPLGLVEFFRYAPKEVEIVTEGFSERITPFLLTAANIEQYGGGAFISPGAKPDDGLLDLCLVPKINIFKALNLAYRLFTKKVNNFDGFRCIRTDRAQIKGLGRSVVQADGEHFEWEGDVKLGILPGKLKVLT
ncbi:MAG: diacylglycerol kinase family lipid kinase [Deltaproteobacteria bacterium]|nr:diacylglycerol kinase family lipid kinase [Deltaproteobacteria bacterium]